MAALARIPRKLMESCTVDYLRHAGGTRPDLRIVDLDGRKLVVKDFKHSDPLFRLVVGPVLIRREFGALRNLLGVQGVPHLAGVVDRYALAMELIPGRRLDHVPSDQLSQPYFDKLALVMDDIHVRGVAHCDMRSRGNAMLGDDGEPYVVDFAACVFRGRGFNPFFVWLFRQFALADRNAILRIKDRFASHLMTDEDRAELAKPLPLERPAKAFGESVRNITRKLLTRNGEP
jgi:hypothetical protein